MFKSRWFIVIGLMVSALAMAVSGGSVRADDVEVAPGDTCWGLAEYYTGDGSRWPELCNEEANRVIIEAQAVSHGLPSSEGGHWVFPPRSDGSNATVLKLPLGWVDPVSAASSEGSSDGPGVVAVSPTVSPAGLAGVAVPSAESSSLWSDFWRTLMGIFLLVVGVLALVTALAVIMLMFAAIIWLAEALDGHHHDHHYGHDHRSHGHHCNCHDRPCFGPDQVRSRYQLKVGKRYYAVGLWGAQTVFTVTRAPYQDNQGGWWIDTDGYGYHGHLSLGDHSVVARLSGDWNTLNYVAFVEGEDYGCITSYPGHHHRCCSHCGHDGLATCVSAVPAHETTHVIKEYYPGGKTAKRRCVIRTDTCDHCMTHFLALLQIAQEDFPGLDPNWVAVVEYSAASRDAITWGIEFVPLSGTVIPSDYRTITMLRETF